MGHLHHEIRHENLESQKGSVCALDFQSHLHTHLLEEETRTQSSLGHSWHLVWTEPRAFTLNYLFYFYLLSSARTLNTEGLWWRPTCHLIISWVREPVDRELQNSPGLLLWLDLGLLPVSIVPTSKWPTCLKAEAQLNSDPAAPGQIHTSGLSDFPAP